MININLEDFAEVLMSDLKKYTMSKTEKIQITAEKIGRKALRKIKKRSPRLTGDYRKGWVIKIIRRTPTSLYIRIEQKGEEWRLTHLLEDGHETRKPGRRARAFPHIQNIEDEANAELAAEIDRILRE